MEENPESSLATYRKVKFATARVTLTKNQVFQSKSLINHFKGGGTKKVQAWPFSYYWDESRIWGSDQYGRDCNHVGKFPGTVLFLDSLPEVTNTDPY